MAKTVVTGLPDIDRALKRFEENLKRKFVRDATKKAAQIALKDFKARVPVDSGSMRDAAKVKAARRSRVSVGRAVVIDRNKLFQLYAARNPPAPGSKKTARPHPRKADGEEPFFYAAMVELQKGRSGAGRPLRDALYKNDQKIIAEFRKSMRESIRNAGRSR